jgi:hypothetical protein
LRSSDDANMDNQVTMMSVCLGTDIPDPRRRLLSIRESANTAKEITSAMANGYDANIAVPGLPSFTSALTRLADKARLADVLHTPINLVISNVPGPRETLYSNGARMLTHYPVSIPVPGMALNITVQSYRDTLYFSITACKKALPEASLLRDDMMASYRELKQLLAVKKVSPIVPEESASVVSVTESPVMDRVA